MELSQEQKDAVSFLVSRCVTGRRNRTRQQLGFQGGAGTGKSLTSAHPEGLITSLESRGLTVGVAASTHIAADVLRDYLSRAGINIEVTTVAAVLGLREVRRGGNRTFEPKGKSRLSDVDVWLMEESSMLHADVVRMIRQQQTPGQSIIFMGDGAQLCPVEPGEGEFKLSPAIDLPSDDVVELQQVRRFTGVLLGKATTLRLDPDHWKERWKPGYDSQSVIDCVANSDELRKLFKAELVERCREGGSCAENDSRMLCYTNRQVDYWNRCAFNALYGGEAEPYQLGMTLLTRDAIAVSDRRDDGGKTLLWGTSAPLKIQSDPQPACVRFRWEDTTSTLWDYWEFESFSTRTEQMETVRVLDPSQQERWKKEKMRLAKLAGSNKGRWADFWTLYDHFADMQYGWASTVHRAQGRGLDTVYLDLADLAAVGFRGTPKLAQSLIYTATTRSRRRIVCVGG